MSFGTIVIVGLSIWAHSRSCPGGEVMSDDIAADQLRSIVERVEAVQAEIDERNDAKAEIFTEARGNGYDVKALKTLIARRRKDPAKLAFEHITHYIEHGHGHAADADHGEHAHGDYAADAEAAPSAESDTVEQETADYYTSQLEAGSRIGFIYQKLKEPRSYDFD